LPLEPKFSGSNPAEDDGFLKSIKIRSKSSFGGEVKLVVPCRKILRHVKDPYGMKEILVSKIQDISHEVFLALLLGFFAGSCQKALEDESGLIRFHMGKHYRSVMVAVYGTPCAIPPSKQQQYHSPIRIVLEHKRSNYSLYNDVHII
jgi:hypothetical protein